MTNQQAINTGMVFITVSLNEAHTSSFQKLIL